MAFLSLLLSRSCGATLSTCGKLRPGELSAIAAEAIRVALAFCDPSTDLSGSCAAGGYEPSEAGSRSLLHGSTRPRKRAASLRAALPALARRAFSNGGKWKPPAGGSVRPVCTCERPGGRPGRVVGNIRPSLPSMLRNVAPRPLPPPAHPSRHADWGSPPLRPVRPNHAAGRRSREALARKSSSRVAVRPDRLRSLVRLCASQGCRGVTDEAVSCAGPLL